MDIYERLDEMDADMAATKVLIYLLLFLRRKNFRLLTFYTD